MEKSRDLYLNRAVPPLKQVIPLGLQPVVAAIVGIVTPTILVANTCGIDGADRTLLIQVSHMCRLCLPSADLTANQPIRNSRGGIVTQGLVSVVGAFFGGLPAATYSQNVGIVTVNRVVNKVVFGFAAVVLLIAGFVPKFASILTTIPQCVIGGATISVFATITMTGIRMITSTKLTPRNTAVVGLSVALGVGVTTVSGCLAGFPQWVTTVFGSSSVVIATLMAILLNTILPKEQENTK